MQRLAGRFGVLTRIGAAVQPRQRSLQSLVDWSYSLCSVRERALWARLSVFAGSFDLAAVESVCADSELPAEAVYDLVDRLVAQSVVVVEPDGDRVRFRLLETIRQYGRERLAEQDLERVVRRRHLDHYLTVAERVALRWCGPTQAADLALLRTEFGNLRAAYECALDLEDHDTAARLVTALRLHWYTSVYLGQGRSWLDEVLLLPGSEDALRARVLSVAVWVCLLLGDAQVAIDRLAECVRIAERGGGRRALTFATYAQGMQALFCGELDLAVERFDTAVRLFDRDGDVEGLLWVRFPLALALSHLGVHDRATVICHRSLRLSSELGEQLCRSYTLWVLGLDTWRRGDPAGATRLLGEGLTIQRSFDDPIGAALMIEVLAWIAASQDLIPLAAARLEVARSLWTDIGTAIEAFGLPLRAPHDACEARVLAAGGSAAAGPARLIGRVVRVSDLIADVLDGVPDPARRDVTPASRVRRGARGGESRTDPAGSGGTRSGSGGPGLPTCSLTARELAVAELVAGGLTNRAIAARLVVSPRTVDGHLERILAKLGFTSRAQVAAWFTEHGR